MNYTVWKKEIGIDKLGILTLKKIFNKYKWINKYDCIFEFNIIKDLNINTYIFNTKLLIENKMTTIYIILDKYKIGTKINSNSQLYNIIFFKYLTAKEQSRQFNFILTYLLNFVHAKKEILENTKLPVLNDIEFIKIKKIIKENNNG